MHYLLFDLIFKCIRRYSNWKTAVIVALMSLETFIRRRKIVATGIHVIETLRHRLMIHHNSVIITHSRRGSISTIIQPRGVPYSLFILHLTCNPGKQLQPLPYSSCEYASCIYGLHMWLRWYKIPFSFCLSKNYIFKFIMVGFISSLANIASCFIFII